MDQGSQRANSGSSFIAAVKQPATCSIQNRSPLDVTRAVPAESVPVLVGTNQPLRGAFASQCPALTPSITPVHLLGPNSHYMPQVPVTHTPAVIGSLKSSGSSSSNRLGYFQQVPSGVNPTALIPRGPQLTPSAFIARSAGSVACPLPTPDAMGYLEQVKMQFASKQQIYNEFLEAMKSFKDQRLDLLGVVKRIGALFLGFSHLINGFNTFMPHGYRLDVSNDRAERIVVYSPTGKMHAFSEDELLEERQTARLRNLEPSIVYRPSVNEQVGGEDTFVPPESSSAIAYVNKIKIRFQKNPEVYQQFLDILQAYQKEQLDRPADGSGRSSMADAQVFSKVAKLFANDKDLLQEFSQFLPDAPLMQLEQPSSSVLGTNTTTSTIAGTTTTTTTTTSTTTSTSSSSSSSSSGSSNGSCRETAAASTESAGGTVADDGQEGGQLSSESSCAAASDGDFKQLCLRTTRGRRKRAGAAPVAYSESVMTTRKRARGAAVQMEQRSVTMKLAMFQEKKNSEETVSCDQRDRTKECSREISFDKYMFIEKLRHTVNNDDAYTGLLCVLKLLNLSYLKPADVQEVFHSYLPNDLDLKEWFSKTTTSPSTSSPFSVGGEGISSRERIVSNGCPNVDFGRCKQLGVSYRLIPTMYQYPKCTGRTALGKEVLNFKYLSFPILQSEENPTVASKRSPYQETLYTTEDERFEADMVIAVNRCLIEGLRSATMKMGSCRVKQRCQLDETLNTRSVTIAQRALRLVLNDAWKEFYTCIRDYPGRAIPLVLKVLLEKNDEWQSNLPSMNRTWYEMNEKSYWKALDYQYISFKTEDVKSMRTRALLNNVEALFKERLAKAESENKKIPSGPHVVIPFPAYTTAFHDVGDLVIHYVKRQTNINPLNKQRITRIVKLLLPALFHLEPGKLSDTEQELPALESRSKAKSVSNGSSGRGAASRGRCRGGWRRRGSTKGRGSAKTAATSSEACGAATDQNQKSECVQDVLILQDVKLLRAMPEYSIMFMPNPWYVFLRLYCILNKRLTGFYEICCDLVNRFGEEESSYLYQTAVLRNRFTSKSDVQPRHLYSQFFNLTKHWLDSSIESTTYENAVRDVFTLRAYKAFTILKIIQMMSRQLQLMVSDLTAVKAFKLYETWASKICWTPDAGDRQMMEASYQAEAMSLMDGQNCFKILFLPMDNRKVSFELVNTILPDEETKKQQQQPQEQLQQQQQDQQEQESCDGVLKKGGEEVVKRQFLQRNVNQATNYFTTELLATQAETASKCGRRNGASRTGPQMARTVSQLFYWQRSSRMCQSAAGASVRNRHSFKMHVFRKFWNIDRREKERSKKKDDKQAQPKHGQTFCYFHEKWIVENVTKEQCRHSNEMLTGTRGEKNMAATWMWRCEEPCSRRPPYFVVNRYLKWKEKR
ncbi:paired amphipathic helix protein Sin3a [Trichuris trichiura]|uniref:Paired amphipathic helix protein Sin3a n=1 Tax=Trichuris trichiura TaxID=36087 RepID=A0A077YY81_TRITR|nr:paired amphipathic helix protein Sin3a [Trichuris trichiura]